MSLQDNNANPDPPYYTKHSSSMPEVGFINIFSCLFPSSSTFQSSKFNFTSISNKNGSSNDNSNFWMLLFELSFCCDLQEIGPLFLNQHTMSNILNHLKTNTLVGFQPLAQLEYYGVLIWLSTFILFQNFFPACIFYFGQLFITKIPLHFWTYMYVLSIAC